MKLHIFRSPSHPPGGRGTLIKILSPPPTRGVRGDRIREQPHKKLILTQAHWILYLFWSFTQDYTSILRFECLYLTTWCWVVSSMLWELMSDLLLFLHLRFDRSECKSFLADINQNWSRDYTVMSCEQSQRKENSLKKILYRLCLGFDRTCTYCSTFAGKWITKNRFRSDAVPRRTGPSGFLRFIRSHLHVLSGTDR